MKIEKKQKRSVQKADQLLISPVKTLIIVPAFNAVQGLVQILPDLPLSHTVVIDDGSVDGTAEVAVHLGHNVISHKQNLGLSGAIQTGEQYAVENGYTHVLLMDADGQHPPQLYKKFLMHMTTRSFVLGDRFSRLCYVPTQKIASNLFASLMIKSVTGVFIRDVACGYRGYALDQRTVNNNSSGYSFIYDQVVDLALKAVLPVRVRIPALYDIDQPLATKYSEIRDFSYSLASRFPDYELVAILNDLLEKKMDLNISVESVPFVAHYVRKWDSYIFNTDICLARKYYGN